MFTFKDMKENQEIIKEVCAKYRKELTILGGVIGEKLEIVNYDEYVKFMNDLSDDEFNGNYLTNLLAKESIETYKKILSDEIGFNDYAKNILGNEFDIYIEKLV